MIIDRGGGLIETTHGRATSRRPVSRRGLLTAAGATAASGAVLVGSGFPSTTSPSPRRSVAESATPTAVLPLLAFALNLKYLQAEFWLHAITGGGLAAERTVGTGVVGAAVGARAVLFESRFIAESVREVAQDQARHVGVVRAMLGDAAIARPALSFGDGFAGLTAAAPGAAGELFDPFATEADFLAAAVVLQDLSISALQGMVPALAATPLSHTFAAIATVEAYHAGVARASLFGLAQQSAGARTTLQRLTGAVDDLGGTSTAAFGRAPRATLIPTNRDSLTVRRSVAQTLNVLYGTPARVTRGGFFPRGVNGPLRESAG